MSSHIPQFDNFSITLHGAVAVLAYNLPDIGNSLRSSVFSVMAPTQGETATVLVNQLSFLDHAWLTDAMKWAIESPTVRVIVQTGTGRFFTTGRYMGEESSAVDNSEALRIFKEVNEVLIRCPKVLIAAVNGPAVGYGTTSLALYDLAYSVPEAYFFTPFSKWALCPEGCSSVTFSSIMGHQKAAALLLAGERMTAEELWTAGLITKIIPAESNAAFMKQVFEVAERIASYPPVALAASKKLMCGNRRAELLAANERECQCLTERLGHQESKDGFLRFMKEQQDKKANRNHGVSHI